MYHRLNKFQDALKCFSKVLARISDDKTVYIARGVVYQDMGNHQLAIRDFNDSIKIDPELSEGYYRRGISQINLMNPSDAIEDFKLAKQHEDEEQVNAGIPDGLGQCYHMQKKYNDALHEYEAAIELEPENTDFMMHRAQCYVDMKNYDASIRDLNTANKCAETDP